MSPEQCLDEDLDGRSDVYSLACVIYEALTGKSPLCARTAFETMNRHLTAMPAPLATVRADLRWPDKLEATLSRAYAKKPKDRYQSMAEFQTALKKVIGLAIEIEWPERWTARSERTEADLKIVEMVSAAIVSASVVAEATIAPSEFVVLPAAIEPTQAIELLIAHLAIIPQRLMRVGKLERQIVLIRSVTLGGVWKAAMAAPVREAVAKLQVLPAELVAPNSKLQYPLTGYLFCTSDGDKIAISIHNAVGLICTA